MINQSAMAKGLFSKITNRAEAIKIIKDSSYGFFFVAALHGVLGLLVSSAMVIDGIILGVLAGALLIWKSRITAVLLTLLTGIGIGFTIMNFATQSTEGGRNVWLAVLMFWTAIRATQASFLLHGKFANEDAGITTQSQNPKV